MRGKSIQPAQECLWDNKPLPELRHPKALYCDAICRGRDRWAREHVGEGVKCLICGKMFNRVGSHVVQVHGYESTAEYTKEFGLLARETHTKSHKIEMREKVTQKAIENLKLGKDNRYVEGGDHGEHLKQFWANRRRLSERRR